MKQEYSNYFTDVGSKHDKGNIGSQSEETVTGLNRHCYLHVLCFNPTG